MKILIAANWKAYLPPVKTAQVAAALVRALRHKNIPETVVCPSALALTDVARILKGSGVHLGAQDLDLVATPASTGSIAATDLRAVGCRYVIVGHSERRAAGETDLEVRLKVKAALDAGLSPILCVGETASERSAGNANRRVLQQLRVATRNLPLSKIVIAYEPVWAISGHAGAKRCDPQTAATMYRLIKKFAPRSRILYGGSVTANDVGEYLATGFNGALVGRSSTSAREYATILRVASLFN